MDEKSEGLTPVYRKKKRNCVFSPKKKKKVGENTQQTHIDLKRAAFVTKYVETLSCTEAAEAAGYSNPKLMGSRLLRDTNISTEISAILKSKAETAGITAESVLATIERAMKRAEDEGNLPMIYKGAELLGKHLGLFAEKIQHDTRIEIVIPGFDSLPVRGPTHGIESPVKRLNWEKDIIQGQTIDITGETTETA
jgi:phage terminase small subunit